MKRISSGFILPSAALTITLEQLGYYQFSDKQSEVGDIVYGIVEGIGQHSKLDEREGSIIAHLQERLTLVSCWE